MRMTHRWWMTLWLRQNTVNVFALSSGVKTFSECSFIRRKVRKQGNCCYGTSCHSRHDEEKAGHSSSTLEERMASTEQIVFAVPESRESHHSGASPQRMGIR